MSRFFLISAAIALLPIDALAEGTTQGQWQQAAGPTWLQARKRRRKRKRNKKPTPAKKEAPAKEATPAAASKPEPSPPAAKPEPAVAPEAEDDPAKRFGEKPGVAIMEIAAMHGVEPSLAELLGGNLNTAFQSTGRFDGVISSTDVQAMLSHEQQAQALGCDDTSCIAALGGALGVPLLVVPSLGRAGGRFILNVKVIAVEEAVAVARLTRLYTNEASLVSEIQEVGTGLAAMVFGEKSSLPTVPPVVEEKAQSKLPQMVGAGLAVSGTIAFVSSYFVASARQTEFDNTAQKDAAAVDGLLGSQTMVSTLWGGGLLVGLSGAGLFTWGMLQ